MSQEPDNIQRIEPKPIGAPAVKLLTPEEQQAVLTIYDTILNASVDQGMQEEELDENNNPLPRKPVRLLTWAEVLRELAIPYRRFKETVARDENFAAEVQCLAEMTDQLAEAVVRTEAISNRDVRAASKIMDRSAAPKTLIDMRTVTVNNNAEAEPGYVPKKRVEQIAKQNDAAVEGMLKLKEMLETFAPQKGGESG